MTWEDVWAELVDTYDLQSRELATAAADGIMSRNAAIAAGNFSSAKEAELVSLSSSAIPRAAEARLRVQRESTAEMISMVSSFLYNGVPYSESLNPLIPRP